ncbi:MAG: ATP-dependent DNA helicase RecG [Actinobacteria bacterium]|nr:MAG: ATP-dependent DNA helicase RecG [Actinomycetota bacterium]
MVKTVEIAARKAWSSPASRARYVGNRYLRLLERLGIRTIGDLLLHVPFRYLDMGDVKPISSVKNGEQVTVAGVVRKVSKRKVRRGLSILSVGIYDGTGYIFGTWFNQDFIAGKLIEGTRVAFSGKALFEYGKLQIHQPLFDVVPEGAEAGRVHTSAVIPIYAATEGLSSNMLRRILRHALEDFTPVPDPLPVSLACGRGLVSRSRALWDAHFPPNLERKGEALRRLVYEELFVMQLGIATRRRSELSAGGISHSIEGKSIARLRACLPFELTGDQERVIEEVVQDMRSPQPMHRLIQGEVGSGKTVVAMAALLAAVESGYQAAIMAPTEVLAVQHYEKVQTLFGSLGVRCVLLVGSSSEAEKQEVYGRIKAGEADVVIGTHALIQEAVDYDKLGIAVIDEQHRFGVRQRLSIREKGSNPDVLVMTATPIPRTLALTFYGDLDVSVLRQLPGGRVLGEHVETVVCDHAHRRWAYELVRSEVSKGRQAYVVCALIDESEKLAVKAVTEELEQLRSIFEGFRIGLLHGRLKPSEKSRVMEEFREGNLDILLATTVIEVGIDVPNATVMIVEDAERFGLSQLHQLRGRIGRGGHKSYCLLFADPTTDEGKERMEAIAGISDGFELAEADLRIRGEGQLFGPRQAGLPDLHVASLGRDSEILEVARADAFGLVERDPRLERPEHGPLREEVMERFESLWEWMASG